MKKILVLNGFLIAKLCIAADQMPQCMAAYEIIFREEADFMFKEHSARPQFVETDLNSEIALLKRTLNVTTKQAEQRQIHEAYTIILDFWRRNESRPQ